MKRLNPDSFGLWGHQGLLNLYGRVAIYGESYLRPFFLYLLLGFVFAPFYLWADVQALSRNIAYDFVPWNLDAWRIVLSGSFWRDFLMASLGSLAAAIPLVPIGQDMLRPLSGWTFIIRYVDMALDVLLLALTLIALRRRFRR